LTVPLHGPPGAGKSRFSRVLADACGLPLRRIAGPDASIVTVLAGNGRGWRAPQASAPVETIAALGVRNPIILVDDADRMPTGTHNGDPRAILLAFLERGTAQGYLDPLLAVPCDLAAVNWILTANATEPLGDALLDRLYRIEVPSPPATAVDTVLTGMMADIAAEVGIAPDGLPGLSDEVRAALGTAFAEEGTALRRVARALRAALGAQATGADPLAAAREVLSAARATGGRHPIGFVRPSPNRA
jgi:hypothetical protein